MQNDTLVVVDRWWDSPTRHKDLSTRLAGKAKAPLQCCPLHIEPVTNWQESYGLIPHILKVGSIGVSLVLLLDGFVSCAAQEGVECSVFSCLGSVEAPPVGKRM